MKKKLKQKPPSRIKYEITHPTVSFRIEKKLFDELKTLLKNKNQSMGDFFRIALKKQQNYNNIYNKGFMNGYDSGSKYGEPEGHEKFTVICIKCGKPVLVDIKSNPSIKKCLDEAFKNWAHITCIG